MMGPTMKILLSVIFLQKYWKDIMEIIMAILAIGFVLKISIKRKGSSNKVTQKGNKVKGDQAGRDINK